jgi:hypothetical protein
MALAWIAPEVRCGVCGGRSRERVPFVLQPIPPFGSRQRRSLYGCRQYAHDLDAVPSLAVAGCKTASIEVGSDRAQRLSLRA